jgi:hypothetical protein
MSELIQDIPRKIRGKFNKDLLLNSFFEHTDLFSPAANKFLKEGKYCGKYLILRSITCSGEKREKDAYTVILILKLSYGYQGSCTFFSITSK